MERTSSAVDPPLSHHAELRGDAVRDLWLCLGALGLHVPRARPLRERVRERRPLRPDDVGHLPREVGLDAHLLEPVRRAFAPCATTRAARRSTARTGTRTRNACPTSSCRASSRSPSIPPFSLSRKDFPPPIASVEVLASVLQALASCDLDQSQRRRIDRDSERDDPHGSPADRTHRAIHQLTPKPACTQKPTPACTQHCH